MALTVPRLMPVRRAMSRCERRPSRNIRRISSTIVVAIIVQFSPKVAILRFWLDDILIQLEHVPRVLDGRRILAFVINAWHDSLLLEKSSLWIDDGPAR